MDFEFVKAAGNPLQGNTIVYLDDKMEIEVTVGTTLVFYQSEVQSLPNRWLYLISDESLIIVSGDKVEDKTSPNAAPGGDSAYRKIEFVTLAPGECVISFRDTVNWHDDGGWDKDFQSELMYHIMITE